MTGVAPSSLTSPLRPSVTQTCAKTLDPLTGIVGISTEYSYEYNPLIEEAISRYVAEVHHITAEDRIDLPVISFTYDSTLETLIEVISFSGIIM